MPSHVGQMFIVSLMIQSQSVAASLPHRQGIAYASQKNPAVAESGFPKAGLSGCSRDSTNWGRGLAPRGVANSRHTAAPRDTSGATRRYFPNRSVGLYGPPDASANSAPPSPLLTLSHDAHPIKSGLSITKPVRSRRADPLGVRPTI